MKALVVLFVFTAMTAVAVEQSAAQSSPAPSIPSDVRSMPSQNSADAMHAASQSAVDAARKKEEAQRLKEQGKIDQDLKMPATDKPH